MNRKILGQVLIVGSLLLSCAGAKQDEKQIRLNEIQVIGSHNSYKQPIDTYIWEMMYQEDSLFALSLDYSHIPLLEQLNLGLRALELDVYHDPQGGRFSEPYGLQLEKEAGITPKPFDMEGKLDEPGLKVFHIQDLDFRSDYLLFKEALKALKKWSLENPEHSPVFVTLNAKDYSNGKLGYTNALPFTKSALDSIDIEIASVFGDDQLITPDFVRGNEQSLENAILTQGWPLLKDVKGRFMFVLDEKGEKRQAYIDGHKGLLERKMFVNSAPGTTESAFVILNNPMDDKEQIQSLVAKGYIVRTRADDANIEAKNNDYKRFESAINSGAQIISTDYYITIPKYNNDFQIKFRDGGAYYREK
ncbi:MAG: phosphatidylinositol-specific phospholipase C1-like protein [Carboxylicivirga sp.]|jgi:hypothetical protein|nr:phosphatidylinositol-specific phospholipase C1-like protein [Carboxylicivirga sp.]